MVERHQPAFDSDCDDSDHDTVLAGQRAATGWPGCAAGADTGSMESGVSGRLLLALGDMDDLGRLATIVLDGQEVWVVEEDLSPAMALDSLVGHAREGDQNAWDALVERFLPLVCAVIARHRLAAADADDVNQTVWLRLVEHLDGIREPAALPGWIATTARNECLRVIRGATRSISVDPQGPSPLERLVSEPADVEEMLVTELRLQGLREALLELPPARRELLLLLLTDPPLAYAEISERLGIPVGSIGPTRARCLAQLRRSPALQGLGFDEDMMTGER